MYRVVLIDDEPLITEGLRKIVSWEKYHCEVVGTAEDAVSGAELIRSLQPHILFTDIRMPGDDGLTMLAGLRSEFPEMQVAVLTGYREFSYAQEAIRLGVTRFLLKPSKHYAEKLTLQDVADACYVSQWHLSKLMNRHTGKSFYDILNTLRIRAAKDLLKDPGLRISDIGEMVGYADTAHFAKVFKKLVGMSANEYRNSL